MAITFQPVTLDGSHGDNEGVLIVRDERLVGVASHLDAFHGEQSGRWFVEIAFPDLSLPPERTFASLGALESWLTEQG